MIPSPRTLLAAIFLSVLPVSATAQEVTYDTETCAEDPDGKVYVRLSSGLSFAFPLDDLIGLRDPRPKNAGPVTDPDGSRGCPGNPIVTRSASVIYRPVPPPADGEPADPRWSPHGVTLYGHDGPTGVQEVNLSVYQSICGDEGARGTTKALSSGLLDCRNPDPEDANPWEMSGGFLVASKGTYTEYNGLPFIARCNVDSTNNGSRYCATQYKDRAGLSVSYRFQDGAIPPDLLLDFDRQVRAFIEARRTPQYDVEIQQN